jgi:N-acetyl-anhydromuramyl-L-alanine amidase AmpD
MRDSVFRATCIAGALAVTAVFGVLGDRRVVAGPPDNVRTFEVTLDGDKDGKREIGTATATLDTAASGPEKTVYKLARTIAGDSSGYATGTATVLAATHAISIEFDVTPGIAGALDGGSAAAASVVLKPMETGDEFIFSGTWQANGLTLTESWRELTHLMAGIKILSPVGSSPVDPDGTDDAVALANPDSPESESDPDYAQDRAQQASAAVGPNVDFKAQVSIAGTDHVQFFVDDNLIASWKGSGTNEKLRLLNTPGWRRFIVKAFGPATKANPQGALLGEADVTFLARGLVLTPENGATIDANHAVVEATPVGLSGVAMIDFCLDGKDVATKKTAPYALDLPLATKGAHMLQAVAFDANRKEIARASSSVNVVLGAKGPNPPPPPINPSKSIPSLVGRPAITQVPAYPGNYRSMKGTTRKILKIVIHKAEGSLDATTSWFANPAARVSAHYCVDDTHVTQMVQDNDIAWHTGSNDNNTTIGIENSGDTHKDDMTDAHYERLAQLVAWLCHQHGIKPTHVDAQKGAGTIIGHNEIKNPHWPAHGVEWGGIDGHEDPGPYWDWDGFMTKVMKHYQDPATNP